MAQGTSSGAGRLFSTDPERELKTRRARVSGVHLTDFIAACKETISRVRAPVLRVFSTSQTQLGRNRASRWFLRCAPVALGAELDQGLRKRSDRKSATGVNTLPLTAKNTIIMANPANQFGKSPKNFLILSTVNLLVVVHQVYLPNLLYNPNRLLSFLKKNLNPKRPQKFKSQRLQQSFLKKPSLPINLDQYQVHLFMVLHGAWYGLEITKHFSITLVPKLRFGKGHLTL